MDFYRADGNDTLKYLIFDSQFTTYEHLKKLDNQPTPIKFITIRRRGKRIVEELNARPLSQWKTVRVAAADGKGRLLQVHEEIVFLKGYDQKIRQLAVAALRKQGRSLGAASLSAGKGSNKIRQNRTTVY